MGTLVLRVGASVSWILWLLSTTGWHRLLEGMRGLRLPPFVVSMMMMTVRFLNVELDTVREMHFGRLSRPGFQAARLGQWRWTGGRIADLVRRTRQLAGEVDEGLRSRGWEGDPLLRPPSRLSATERLWFTISLLLAVGAAWLGRR